MYYILKILGIIGVGWSEQSSAASTEGCFLVLFSQVSVTERLLCHETGKKCCAICQMMGPCVSFLELPCRFPSDALLLFEVLSPHSKVLSKPPCHSTATDVGHHAVILSALPAPPALRVLAMTNCSAVSLRGSFPLLKGLNGRASLNNILSSKQACVGGGAFHLLPHPQACLAVKDCRVLFLSPFDLLSSVISEHFLLLLPVATKSIAR